VLPESDVIVAYLEERFPNPTLYPGDTAGRANVRLLSRLMDNYSAPSFGPFLAGDPAAIAIATERIDQALGYVDHFRIDGEFASGNAFSAADCAWIPFFHVMDRLQDGFQIFDLVRKRPRLEAWWLRTRQSEIGKFAGATIDQAIAERMQGTAR
jgi:glutathione S-transferase